MTILIISPHPDDEAIGCGGTICKHIAEGDTVEVIFLTSGEKGGHGKAEDETIIIREKEAQHAADILKLSSISFWREPDGNFEATSKNIKRLQAKLATFKPAIIYVPHDKEDHPDHREAAFLAQKAISGLRKNITKPVLFMYEVWTPIQQMNYIVDISPFVETKRKAILAHKCQCDVLKFDEAIIGLNRYRGEMHSWPGGDYAEVFVQMNFEEKQKILFDKINDKVIIQYDKNSQLFKNQKELYPMISHIHYVPEMTFKKGIIILNYGGETLFKLEKENYPFTAKEKETIKNQLIDFINDLFKCQVAHRDMHIGNICWDGKQIWIIDWEYACKQTVSRISDHYDLSATGLESPSETNYVHIFKDTFQYKCINSLIAPFSISLSDFEH